MSSSSKPQHMLRPGRPARLQLSVKMSAWYISIGVFLAPGAKAVLGAVGEAMTSTWVKAFLKSSAMSARASSGVL